jgi:hypothetical protein
MAESTSEEAAAAESAAHARRAIAERIAALVPKIEGDADAQLVLKLAQAYANLASEPPRARAI